MPNNYISNNDSLRITSAELAPLTHLEHEKEVKLRIVFAIIYLFYYLDVIDFCKVSLLGINIIRRKRTCILF